MGTCNTARLTELALRGSMYQLVDIQKGIRKKSGPGSYQLAVFPLFLECPLYQLVSIIPYFGGDLRFEEID